MNKALLVRHDGGPYSSGTTVVKSPVADELDLSGVALRSGVT
jgi:hypothetical protein